MMIFKMIMIIILINHGGPSRKLCSFLTSLCWLLNINIIRTKNDEGFLEISISSEPKMMVVCWNINGIRAKNDGGFDKYADFEISMASEPKMMEVCWNINVI